MISTRGWARWHFKAVAHNRLYQADFCSHAFEWNGLSSMLSIVDHTSKHTLAHQALALESSCGIVYRLETSTDDPLGTGKRAIAGSKSAQDESVVQRMVMQVWPFWKLE